MRARLEAIPGVASVNVNAGPPDEVRITVDLARAAALGISVPDIANRAASANNVSGGQLAVGRLSPIAYDRAINGRIEQVYRDGELIAERRVPSDKLLTWLLARLDPKRFALTWEQRGESDPQADAAAAFPALLDGLTDIPS